MSVWEKVSTVLWPVRLRRGPNGLELAHPYEERLGEDTNDISPWLVDLGDDLGHEY